MSDAIQVTRSVEIGDVCVERTSDGRTIEAMALSYGVPYSVSDDGGRTFYNEVWRDSVFKKSLQERGGKIPMLVTHDRQRLPIGVTLGAVEHPGAFVFRGKVSRTRDGDEALELISDGALTGISVGARPLQNRSLADGGVERIQARLEEISLTPFPQMADGKVLAVRAQLETLEDTEEEVEEDPDTPHVSLAEAQEFLASLPEPF